jgi:hypothetical protein
MYRKTAIEIMNNAIMMGLDFFEPVDSFENDPPADKDGGEKKYCDHCFIF